MSPTTLAAALSAGLLFSLTGCVPTSDDPLACKDNGSCDHQEERTFCDIDRAYPDTIQPNECIVPPSADACNRVAACDDPAKPHCTDDSMGTCVECTDNAHCTVDGESCNTNTGECGDFSPCTPGDAGDAECAANGDGLDFCSDGGLCAECIDDTHCTGFANEGTCDTVSLECRACEVGGSDCDSGLCGTRDDGECVPVADVIRVDGANTGGDVAGCGAVGSECETIGFAITQVDDATKNIIVVAAGTYDERLDITEGTMTILGDRQVVVNPSLNAGAPLALAVSGSAAVTILGISIAPASGTAGTDAVSCSGGGTLTLDGVAVSNATDLGVIGDNCDLTVTASTISGNQGGGISVNGGDFNIVNNFIVKNGTTGSAVGGLRVAATAGNTEVLDFNTIASNVKADAVGYAIECSGVNLVATNNILMLDPVISGGLITICNTDYSLIDSNTGANGGTQTNVVSAQASFVAPIDNDFHLESGSPGINEADPAATLDTDIDSEERPQGGVPDIGADEAE